MRRVSRGLLLALAASGCDPATAPPPPGPKPPSAWGSELGLHPGATADHLRRAEELLKEERLAEAAEVFRAALRRDEKDVAALVGLSRIALRLGDAAGGAVFVAAAAKLRPDDGAIANHLAVALVQGGRPREASGEFERARALKPRDPLILLNAALCWGDLEEWDRALDCATRARDLVPEAFTPHLILGRLRVRQGRPTEAVPHLQEAARRGPGKPVIQYHLGKALRAAGREAEAVEALRASLRGDPPPEIRREVEALLSKP